LKFAKKAAFTILKKRGKHLVEKVGKKGGGAQFVGGGGRNASMVAVTGIWVRRGVAVEPRLKEKNDAAVRGGGGGMVTRGRGRAGISEKLPETAAG